MSDRQQTFRRINSQGVESTAGFVVQFTGRFILEYQQGRFSMECHCEGSNIAVPELPFGNLTPQRRSEIVENIRAALEFLEAGYFTVS